MSEKDKRTDISNLCSYFIITFVFTWFFWIIGLLTSRDIIPLRLSYLVWVVIGAHGPLAASFWLSYRANGIRSAKKLLFSGFRLRMRFIWWVAILVGPSILAGLAFWINTSTGNFNPDTTLLEKPLLIVPNLVFMFFMGGSFQEEFGWRGFALPRLLSLYTPFSTSVILGVIWGFWHLPLFYIVGLSQSFMNFGLFLPSTIAFSFFFTWIYFRTNYNLFSALLLHAVINTSFSVFPPTEQIEHGSNIPFAILLLFYITAAAILIIWDKRFWFKKAEQANLLHG